MKTALIGLLLVLVPLSSLRMVCVTAHDLSAVQSAAGDAAAAAAEAECARVCKRHVVPPAPPAAAGMTCLLVADPACEILASGGVAVLPAAAVLPIGETVAAIAAFSGSGYVSPSIARRSPPPRLAI